MIPGGNVKIMVSRSSKALVHFVSCLPIFDRTRESVIKPKASLASGIEKVRGSVLFINYYYYLFYIFF